MRRAHLLVWTMPLILAVGCEDDSSDFQAPTDTSTPEMDTGAPEPTDSGEGADTDSDSATEATDDTGAQEEELPLEVGDEVPDFSLATHDGGIFTLSDTQGSLVLIGTHPFAGTSVCTQQTKDLEENYDAFAALDTIPFGMGVDGSAQQAAWATKMGIEKLQILSDSNPRGEVSDMFGFYDKATKASKRGVLIIDREGVLRFKKVYPMAICPALGPIFEELEKLQ